MYVVVNLTLPKITCVYDINWDELGMLLEFLKLCYKLVVHIQIKIYITASCRFLLTDTKFIFGCEKF